MRASIVGALAPERRPANILLVPDATGAPPVVKVLDFGAAKLAAEAGGMKTAVGTMLGTPARARSRGRCSGLLAAALSVAIAREATP